MQGVRHNLRHNPRHSFQRKSGSVLQEELGGAVLAHERSFVM